VNVYVNNEDVRLGRGLDTSVGPDSTIIVLPAMAGGG
jgi:molybdopterin converting factor small subunit